MVGQYLSYHVVGRIFQMNIMYIYAFRRTWRLTTPFQVFIFNFVEERPHFEMLADLTKITEL